MSDFTPLEDILVKRGRTGPFLGHTHNFITLFNGKPVELSFYQPDPNTFRDDYYYNSRENQLFKKILAGDQFVWKPIGDC